MWTKLRRFVSGNTTTRQVFVCLILLPLSQSRELQSPVSSTESAIRPARPEFVVLIDTNADQENVFAVEQSLALDIVQQLGEKGFSFSLLTSGAGGPRQVESGVGADNTLNAIRDLTLEPVHEKKVAPPELYEALIAARAVFDHDASERAVLVISGGRDDLDGKRYKQIKSAFRNQKIVCHVAIVSSHPLYGTKGIQVRGFYLHDLAGKTHGRYVELGRSEKKVPAAAEKLVEQILQREGTHVR